MDDDIQFGDVEENPPQRRLRPDQNRHYAVVNYQAPGQDDLRIYVDVDVMRDMEAHAQSNTNVELGGVLLGGQYEDDEGRPFVVVTDSLRAEHYESTKGSFKFTHQTWSDITRKRDEFPDDLQMVGWYHTHPGWGVFLSGMDTFICDHFFNRPLDIALVIDPCQLERAFFQWTSGAEKRTRLTRGFHLTGSRFRLPELEIYAAQLEGKIPMPSDPRYTGLPGAYPPPVVHIAESRQTWLSVAVLGMLTMQFLFLALLAWRLVAPPQIAAGTGDRFDRDLSAQRALLDRVIGDVSVAPDGVVETLEQQRQKNEELESANIGLLTHTRELRKANERAKDEQQALADKNASLLETIDRLKEDKAAAREKIENLRAQLAQYEETPDEGEQLGGIWEWATRWKWYLVGGILVLIVAAAAALAVYGPKPREDEEVPPGDSVDEPE